MKNKAIVIPSDSIALIEPSLSKHGRRVLQSDTADYKLTVLREGELINSENTTLSVRLADENIGGDHFIRTRPDENGFMLRSFSKPFPISVTFEDEPSNLDWLGQSDLWVKDFYKFDIDGDDEYPVKRDTNGRLLSFNGDLYFLCEQYSSWANNSSNFVRLYKHDGQRFFLVKIFEVPVDSIEPGFEHQFGSPDWFIHEGRLNICYRRVERNTGLNKFVFFDSLDGIEWRFKTEFSFESTSVDFDAFRLRCVSNGDTIMLVVYGVDLFERTGMSVSENHYMNSWVSYDGGYRFESRSTRLSNVITNDTGNGVLSVDSAFSMASFFVPTIVDGYSEADLTGFIPNFDLYYDRDLGSFVILKAGDPLGFDNQSYLIGIRTVDGNYLEWEHLSRIQLSIEQTGDVLLNGVFDTYTEFRPNFDDHIHYVKDVAVVPGDCNNTLFVSLQRRNSTELPGPLGGVAVVEFRYLNNDSIPPGLYDSLFAYGSKTHELFSFVCTPFNFDHCGVYGSGNHNGLERWPIDIAAVRHRGSVWYSDKIYEGVADVYSRRCLVNLAPWSNIGEDIGYEMSYPRFIPDYEAFDLSKVVSGVSSLTYQSEGGFEVDIASNGDDAYLALVTSHSLPTIAERINISAAGFWKSKFQVKIDSVSGTPRIFDCAVKDSSGNGYGVKLNAASSGVISVYDYAGVLLGSFGSGAWGSEFREFLVTVNQDRDGESAVSVWYREEGSLSWSIGGSWAISKHVITNTYCSFGVSSGSTSGDLLYLGNFQFSSYGVNVRRPNTRSKFPNLFETWEPIVNYSPTPESLDSPYVCGTIDLFSDKIELYDGTLLSASGAPSFDRDVDVWTFDRTRSANDLDNITDDLASSVYNFTEAYSGGGTLSLIFEKNRLEDVTSLTILNAFGVYGGTIASGDYDGSTWTDEVSVEFLMPQAQIIPSAINGNRMVIDKTFEDYQIRNYNILLYNTSLGVYEDQYFVTLNNGRFVQVNKPIATGIQYEYYLVSPATSMLLPDGLGNEGGSHLRVELKTCVSASLRQVGSVFWGRVVDLSSHVTSLNKVSSSNKKVSQSSIGYSYMEYLGDSNLVERYSFEMGMARDIEFERLSGLVNSLWLDDKMFVYVESSRDILAIYPAKISGSINLTPSSNIKGGDIKFDMTVQNFRPFYEITEFNEQPLVSVSASTFEPNPGENINFTAVASDPEGATLTYLWNFGDGTTSGLQNPIKAYSEVGAYSFTLTVSDGVTETVVSGNIHVMESPIVSYAYSDDAPGSPVNMTTYNATIVAKDIDNSTVFDDSTLVYFFGDNVEFDLDLDSSWSEPLDDFARRLVDGEISFRFRGTSAGAGTLTIADIYGNYYVETFTFI